VPSAAGPCAPGVFEADSLDTFSLSADGIMALDVASDDFYPPAPARRPRTVDASRSAAVFRKRACVHGADGRFRKAASHAPPSVLGAYRGQPTLHRLCDRCGWVVHLDASAPLTTQKACPGWHLGQDLRWELCEHTLMDDLISWKPVRCTLRTTLRNWAQRRPVPAQLATRWLDGLDRFFLRAPPDDTPEPWHAWHNRGLRASERRAGSSYLFPVPREPGHADVARLAATGHLLALHERLTFWRDGASDSYVLPTDGEFQLTTRQESGEYAGMPTFICAEHGPFESWFA